MLPKRTLLQIALVCLSLATLRGEAQPSQQQFPSSLAPGLYYYFHPGDTKPRIHYVPDPSNTQGDPFATAVKPLPIRGQENFPALPLDTLQRWTYSDFLQYQQQHRSSRTQETSPYSRHQEQQREPPYSLQQQFPPESEQQPSYPQQQAPSQPQQQPFYPQQQALPRPQQQPLYPQQQAMQQPGWQGSFQTSPRGNFQGQDYLAPPGSPFQAEPPERPSPRERKRLRGVPLGKMQQALDMARKALALLDADRNEEARALLERAALLDPNPNSAPIHSSLARAYRRLGNPDRAITEYHAALSFEPKLESATVGIAGCFQEMGKIPEAIVWYQKYLNLKPRSGDQSQVRGMIAALKRAAENGPSDDPNGPDYLASVTSHGTRRWPKEKLPLKVYIEAGSRESGYKKPFKDFLIESFDTWCRAVDNRLTWIPASDPAQADITCQWARTTEGLEQSTGAEGGQTLTEMSVDHEGTRRIEHGRITLLTFTMQGKPVPDAEMRSTALHEVGHVLGLGGHSSNPRDIMFFTVSGSTAKELSSRDMATLSGLYTAYPVGSN